MKNYEGSEQYRPLSPWAYFGYGVLFSIPIVGLIMLIIYSVNDSNINRRNYARSFWCAYILAVIFFIVLIITGSLASLALFN